MMRPMKTKSSLVTKSTTLDTSSFAIASDPSIPPPFPVAGSVQQKIALFENGNVNDDTIYVTEEQYDLTPIKKSRSDRGVAEASRSLTIDPFEIPLVQDDESEDHTFSPTR
jgi:hypothetical protein